ncbi:MAG: bifunctional nicotinamidase/pyrazinamidase [Candidatus Puniceispirillaceae bacterium]
MKNSKALICIDIQNDFCPGGALAVTEGDAIIAPVNQLIERASAAGDMIVMTQDWHPANHASFASQHDGLAPFSRITMPYGEQTLWPDHCVQGSSGAAFHDDLLLDSAHMIVRKGYRSMIDSYSAFFENDRITPTGLHGFLQEAGVSQLMMAGLATDYCVAFSALDAAHLGYEVTVIEHACRAIDLDGSLARQMSAMSQAGIQFAD